MNEKILRPTDKFTQKNQKTLSDLTIERKKISFEREVIQKSFLRSVMGLGLVH